jgi:hypothetical protein
MLRNSKMMYNAGGGTSLYESGPLERCFPQEKRLSRASSPGSRRQENRTTQAYFQS